MRWWIDAQRKLANVRAVQGFIRTTLRAGLGLAALATALTGCGSDPVPPPKVPTPAEMRTYWGLNPGSCWVYKDLSGMSAGLTTSVEGPDTVRIAGRTTYVLTQSKSSGGIPNVLLFDTDTTPGEMYLARISDGSKTPAVTDTYLTDPRPVWGLLEYDRAGALVFGVDGTFESASTPQGGSAPVAHKWTVANRAKPVATPEGMNTGLELRYSKDGALTATYDLVPNYGMARIQLDGVEYQLCQARVCDAAGACTGAPTCAGVVCP